MKRNKNIEIWALFALSQVLFVLLALKIAGVASFSWWVVFSPLVLLAGFALLVLILTFIIACIFINKK